ncbi:hypothetical protein H4219_005512 [Mycoemilia scoparia]|uniref:Metaxin glutathione S-transferase domain-containing protein n=1 Tax=Mycoemilia scoparia TaxID=417184 RepID=A0A9W7ZXB2_9FUNG|nr:hypothetical protein H4219_005512 [Mycoemilia scoparia]
MSNIGIINLFKKVKDTITTPWEPLVVYPTQVTPDHPQKPTLWCYGPAKDHGLTSVDVNSLRWQGYMKDNLEKPSDNQDPDQFAFISLVKHSLIPAIVFNEWIEDENYDYATKYDISDSFPQPLATVIGFKTRQQTLEWLGSRSTTSGSGGDIVDGEHIYKKAGDALEALNEFLGDRPYFDSTANPGELDAIVFACLHRILNGPRHASELYTLLVGKRGSIEEEAGNDGYVRLIEYARRIWEQYFST